MTTTSEGSESPSISYAGSALASSTTYYWRIKFWDDSDAEGDWSTTTATFSLAAASGTSPTLPIFRETLQYLTYTYDSVGNVTKIEDDSLTLTAGTVDYTYDDLYRLKSASTTGATITPYQESYTYSSIGNILTKSDIGSCSYAETNYANPHAATTIGGVSQTYDQNGNLTTTGAGDTYTWNYRNQLTETTNTTGTTSYGYDHNGNRVFKTADTDTAIYPSQYYTVEGATSTKYIYAGDMLVATIEDDTPAPKTYYNHQDHLNSTRISTDQFGYTVNELDYFPFGDTRIDNDYTDFRQHIQHTSNYKDDETSLIYRGARYYDGKTGRFTSMDPYVFGDLKAIINDPQLMNTYGYARNNPLIYHDPNGELPILIPFIAGAIIGAGTVYHANDNVKANVNSAVNSGLANLTANGNTAQYNQSVVQMSNDNVVWDATISNPEMAGFAVGVTGAAAAIPGAAGIANVATMEAGVGLGYVGKMTVGAAAYEYVAANALRSTPDMIQAYTNLSPSNYRTWSDLITTTGLLYGPGVVDDYAGALYDITESAVHLSEDAGLRRKDDDKDSH